MSGSGQDYLAAGVFWLYIVAALYFSVLVIATISSISARPGSDSSTISKKIWLFSTLAAGAFAFSSIGMLLVLGKSFRQWSQSHNVDYSFPNILQDVWQWSLDTKPFYDFIVDLFSDVGSAVTSVLALVATMNLCLYMGIEGRRQQIPRLWAFFCLAQILPIAFSLTLFLIAIIRRGRQPAAPLPSRSSLYGTAGKLFSCIALAIYLVWYHPDSALLLPVVLMARMSLLDPLLAPLIKGAGADAAMQTTTKALLESIPVLALIPNCIVVYGLLTSGENNWQRQLKEHPAASTLSFDLQVASVICIVSLSYGPAVERTKA